MNDLNPFDAAMANVPPSAQALLRPLVRGIAIEEKSRDTERDPDLGTSMLETVGNSAPPPNTRENTSGNMPADVTRTARVTAPDTVGPGRTRDAALLLLIVQLRIVSMQQLAKAVFPTVSVVVARRRIRALQHDGWVRTWDRPVASGGAPRYVYPTAKALRWAFPRLLEDVRGTAAEQVVRLMLPDSTKRLVQLVAGLEPQWFSHQDEINRLVLSRLRSSGQQVVWASAWDCPFPDRLYELKAPQPDYVLVTRVGTSTMLTFGEHDRGTEPIARWTEKLSAYAAAREHAMELFGHTAFIVDVTVTDPLRRAPHRRLDHIVAAARMSDCHAFVRATLAGWAYSDPSGAIWFVNGAAPAHHDFRPGTHHGLQPTTE